MTYAKEKVLRMNLEKGINMQVIIYYGNQNLGLYDLEWFQKEVISFGRQSDNDIILNYEFISRVHGIFYKENGNWYVQDLNSKNGILVNGIYIQNQMVQNLSLIHI